MTSIQKNIAFTFPLSPSRLIGLRGRGWHQVDYIVKFVVFTLTRLKGKVGGLRVMFVQVCEWFDGCDRLKLIFKSLKNKITKLYFILKIIKNDHYISLIYRRKNMLMYKWK